jgi:hypothetical protein
VSSPAARCAFALTDSTSVELLVDMTNNSTLVVVERRSCCLRGSRASSHVTDHAGASGSPGRSDERSPSSAQRSPYIEMALNYEIRVRGRVGERRGTSAGGRVVRFVLSG